jgi:hypothetical protein
MMDFQVHVAANQFLRVAAEISTPHSGLDAIRARLTGHGGGITDEETADLQAVTIGMLGVCAKLEDASVRVSRRCGLRAGSVRHCHW